MIKKNLVTCKVSWRRIFTNFWTQLWRTSSFFGFVTSWERIALYYWIGGPVGCVTWLDVVQKRKISDIKEVTHLWSVNSSTGLFWSINNVRNITQRIKTNMASPIFISSVYQSSNIKLEWIIFWSKYWWTKNLRRRLCIRGKCSSHPP
jgi:hypothetical protein